jgi:SAM-dependent methyltransferase
MKTLERCSFCGKGKFTKLLGVKSLGRDTFVVRCDNCRLAFLNPFPGPDEIKRIYSEDYFQYHVDPEVLAARAQAGKDLLERLKKYLPERGRILDVGAAAGAYLSAFKNAGWEAYGVEISDYARESAKKIFGIEMHRDLETAAFKDSYFDFILMNHAIEHLPSHTDFLDKLFSILKPGGILFVAAPNFGSVGAAKMKSNWPQLKPDEHLYFFTPKTLKMVLEKSGYHILKSDTLQPLITTPQFEKMLDVRKAEFIRNAANKLFPGVKRSIRNIIGKLFPGDELMIIAERPRL